jgi:hypothetical protein
MQPITPTLLHAACSWQAEPIVQAIIEDRRIRWRALHDWPAGPDAGPVAQYNNGSITLRMVADEAGRIWMARVWDHGDPDAWESWTLVAGDAHSACDLAVAWIAPYTWLLVYEGAVGHQVLARISTDNGLTWPAPATLHVAAQAPWLAAWGAWAFVLEDQLHAYRWTGAAWSGPHTLGDMATPDPGGVAAYHDPDAQLAHILYSSGGQLHKVELHTGGASPAYTTPRILAPGGDQAGAAPARIVLPSLAWVADLGLVATWVERHTGALSGWGLPVSAVARDDAAQHFGQLCPLAEPQVSSQRWSLAYGSQAKVLYAGNRRRIVSAPVFDVDIRGWMRLGPADALSYRRVAEGHEPGALTVELLDPALAYRNPGDTASAARAIKPLSAVRMRRGYRTAAGIETVDTPNYYITSATLSEGQGAGHLCIRATDVYGLLALWRPVESIQWYGRSVAWLLEEVCGRVGLRVAIEGAPGLQDTLPHFSLHPHQSALTAVQALLRLGRAVARPAADDTLRVLAYPPSQQVAPQIGAAGEVREATYGCARYPYTHARIASEAHDAYAEAECVAASQAMGQRFSYVLEDNRVASEAMAAGIATHILGLAALYGRADQATIPLRPDLEIWDAVTLLADEAAIPASAGARVVARLVEEAAPVRNRHVTQLTLGATPPD